MHWSMYYPIKLFEFRKWIVHDFFENSHFFGYFAHSEVLGFFHQFLENFTSFKYQNFVILGQFLTLENMVEKFFQNSNFSDFLGIKSEISQYIQELSQGL